MAEQPDVLSGAADAAPLTIGFVGSGRAATALATGL
ncbi:MAG: hypothetical protein QOE92_519, partial [Chloroflexota bacterium]|nr:hypothetical protein [Chloroflexota bacterium]